MAEKKEKAETKDKPDLNQKADKTIDNYVGYAMVAGFVPIPLADIIAVTAMQVAMVNELAKIYELEFNKEQARIIITSLVNTTIGATVGRVGASLLKGIPGIGTILGIGSQVILAGATTYAIGHVIKDHFRNNGNLDDFNVSEVTRRYKDFFERGKKVAKEKEQKMNDDEILATIEKLNKLKESGTISEEEFNKTKKDLLARLGKGK